MTPPELDEALVARLAVLADALDGGDEDADAEHVSEFNRLAGTTLAFGDFQGIYGGEAHEDFVRRVLIMAATEARPEMSREELVAILTQVRADATDDAFVTYALTTIEKTFGNGLVWDLLFGNHERGELLTPESMADEILAKRSDPSEG